LLWKSCQEHLSEVVDDLDEVFENVEKEADVAEKVEASKDRTSLQQEIECKSYWTLFTKMVLNIVYTAQKNRQIYAWLAPGDPETNYNSALETHTEGTGDWMYQNTVYKNWESNDNAHVWLHAKRMSVLQAQYFGFG
jgi:hypothetical protein